ncbi:hypothetical protein BKA93DRAFT_734171, partial [Sparassis latifolia]
ITEKIKTLKFDYIILEGISRTMFITKILGVHDLADQYSPSVHSGPIFKLWFTGSRGGKTSAASIENDRDFSITLETLLHKNKKSCTVSVELDLDSMEGFCTRKRAAVAMQDAVNDDELLYGTKVPRAEGFSEESQLDGGIILQLKQRWPCQQHLGEHDEPGYCYIAPSGEHIGLNMHKLRIWASAIRAHDSTKHEPLNTIEFDGVRDDRLLAIKPRGHTGPHTASMSIDLLMLLMMAMLPLITMLANCQGGLPSSSTVTAEQMAPSQAAGHHSLSPAPAVGQELHTCLAAFAAMKNIDMLEQEGLLSRLELTPDIIPEIPTFRISKLTGAVEGHVVKLQCSAKNRMLIWRRRGRVPFEQCHDGTQLVMLTDRFFHKSHFCVTCVSCKAV